MDTIGIHIRQRSDGTHNDAELQIVTVGGRHPQSMSSHANGHMNMRSSNARYSADPVDAKARKATRSVRLDWVIVKESPTVQAGRRAFSLSSPRYPAKPITRRKRLTCRSGERQATRPGHALP